VSVSASEALGVPKGEQNAQPVLPWVCRAVVENVQAGSNNCPLFFRA
jgi:hypothetical protein